MTSDTESPQQEFMDIVRTAGTFVRTARKRGFGSADLTPRAVESLESLGSTFHGQEEETKDMLKLLEQTVSECTKCPLHESRNNTVFGVGNPNAKLMIVGEAPGKNEDLQGEPFVGRAGQLLDKILSAIDLTRDDVYICNIVKCRPPENRNPKPDEVFCCISYLEQQIELIQPDLICALGGVAAHTLLDNQTLVSELRGVFHDFCGVPLIVTYHPAALLRNPKYKRPTWEDMKKVRDVLAGTLEP